ncbi:MAG TPA: hypothetical protein VIW23_17630 [Candidatus Acidoferrum sp.]|jgi:hypothetical protein
MATFVPTRNEKYSHKGHSVKLRTICTVATIFMAFFTIALWKSPVRSEQ